VDPKPRFQRYEYGGVPPETDDEKVTVRG